MELEQTSSPTKRSGPSAYNYSLALLAGQDYSEYKLRQKLKLKGFEPVDVDQALEKLKDKGYLREAEYKKMLAKKLMRKGQADGMIKRRVEQENLSFETHELAELREECGISKEDAITQLVAKKMRGQEWPSDREKRQKLEAKIYRFLLSRGFSFEDAKKAIKASFQNTSTL